ncbi:MAG: C-GCAxxG-C-C family protein, partial [Desulfomonilaceae bacterium]|nr:C-GCAxxG-C-C family protein [Desulfomonilaceae bacterium]
MEPETAFKLGRTFGAGMGLGLTCGAVTGAFLVLGCTLGEVKETDREARLRAYDLAKEFTRRFEARRNTIECRQLLGVDPGTAEGYAEAQALGLFRTVCPGLVRDA